KLVNFEKNMAFSYGENFVAELVRRDVHIRDKQPRNWKASDEMGRVIVRRESSYRSDAYLSAF
ncbi:hypothetical protein, partial [Rhodopirellula bahusiensis]|uniref:hypothetical protein n=1 Tax=Rhodopirellula bahusiensis TaxID=2014065 RepID=UPI00326637C3